MRDLATLALALLIAAPLSARAQPAPATASERPNVVILLADDLGPGDLGCYGQTRIRTPRIDALAAEGVRMVHAYSAAPVCAPSRCALMTGLHAGHCTVDHNDQPNLPIGLADPTIAEVLGHAGYRTALIGKWGLGGETEEGEPFGTFSMPAEMGFSHVLAVVDQARAQDHYPERLLAGESWRAIPGNAGGASVTYDEDLFVEDALAFVAQAAREDRPFFLYFASTLPHRTFDPPAVSHAEDDWPEVERAYATMVERFDTDVGRIVDAIDALPRSTIVIVASDNGPVTTDGHESGFFGSAMGLRGQKRDLYEGGLHVPLVVRWRGHFEARESETPVALYDLFATVTDLTATPPPARLDGVSLAPWLRGERTDAAHERLFFLGRERSGSEPATRFATREGPLVLIEREDRVRELYDLEADPAQSEDLAAARPADVERLAAARAEEASGPIARSFPVLALRDEDGHDVLPTDPGTTCMQALDLGSDLATHAPVDLAITGHGTHAEGEAIALPAGAYVTVGAHPAVSFGESSFTVVARVRLDHLDAAPTTGREARRYLALSKPTGARDELLDWALLVQAGDLAAGDPAATGHELAVLFADPDVGGHGTWPVIARGLRITDGAFHDALFQYDAQARTVLFVLDGQRELVTIDHDWGHVRSDGPLVIGAHHDVHGVFRGFLDGAIARFEIDRGLGATDVGCPGRAPTRSASIDLGEIAVGTEVVRRFTVHNTASAPAMGLDVRVSVASGDDRVAVDFTPVDVLGPESGGVPLVVRVRTDALGAIDARMVIDGRVSHVGTTPERLGGQPYLEIHGEVVAAPEAEPERTAPVWLPYAAAAFIVVGARLVFAARARDKKNN
ncbi:MAG: sulfatase-like hydrolase/transferase [Sandaracinus sp.]